MFDFLNDSRSSLTCRDAPASSSEGEEKKPVAAASTSGGSMPEMSADSKFCFTTYVYVVLE